MAISACDTKSLNWGSSIRKKNEKKLKWLINIDEKNPQVYTGKYPLSSYAIFSIKSAWCKKIGNFLKKTDSILKMA